MEWLDWSTIIIYAFDIYNRFGPQVLTWLHLDIESKTTSDVRAVEI